MVNTTKTVYGILGATAMIAILLLAGATAGMIPSDVIQETNIPPNNDNGENNVPADGVKAISFVAFCGDADDVSADGFTPGTSTSISWSATGGDVSDIVYKAGTQEYHIDVNPDAMSGSFDSGDGVTVSLEPTEQDDPCAALSQISEDLIEKIE